ncbi:MAG: DNA repair exonuclease [Clostridia bacterium]|nr:DNA repair exonuclease [Clostridia bacterium]
MKLLHTGDVHLDSPFTLSDPKTAAERKKDLRRSFSDMIAYAGVNKIPLLLISGDLFESEYVTSDTLRTVIGRFETIPFCRIVISPGNHDPYTPDSVWANRRFPDNVHIFTSDKPQKISLDDLGADVYGYAFTSKYMETNPFAGIRPDDPGRINILCAHGDTSSPISKYCPVTKKDISDSGFDYIALGHIHIGTDGIKKLGDTYYAYCGALEGRDFSECGYKGAIEADIVKRGGIADVKGRVIRFSQRRYEWLKLNVTGACHTDEIVRAVSEAAKENGCGSDTHLRVTLTGEVSPGLEPDERAIADSVPEKYSFELRNETVPLFDRDLLEKDPTVRGAFFRLLLPMLRDGTPEERVRASLALRYGLNALDGSDVADY